MLIKLRPIMTLLAITLMMVIPTFAQDGNAEPTPNPQEQRVFDRVDQAMEHLNSYITPTPQRPISRQFNHWSWSEQVWNDAGLGCPLPDQAYEPQTIRGPRIILTFSDVDYVYHMNWDGSLLVMCGNDGTPLYRSDAPDITTTSTSTPNRGFYTWAYDADNQQLYLVDSVRGQIARTPLPNIENMADDGLSQIAFSPDGMTLFRVVRLNDNSQALSVFQTVTGDSKLINSEAGHAISLGFGDHSEAGLNIITRIPASENNRYIAVGFSNESDPSINEWKVSLYDTTTQTFTHELTSEQFAAQVTGDSDFVAQVTNGAKRPVPQFIDNNGAVHFSLVHLFAGGAMTYPTAVWNPTTNTITESNFIYTASDALPNGTTIYTNYDPAYPEVGSGETLFPENNVIFSQNLLDPTSTQQVIVQNPTAGIDNVWWSNNGNQIIYRTRVGDDPVYMVYDLATTMSYPQYGQTIGTNNGVLTAFYNVMNGTATIAHYTSQTTFNDIWASAELNSAPILLWTEGGNRLFGDAPQTASNSSDAATTTATPAPDACGELPSRVTVGTTAQTTEIEGIANFNMRETARLTAAVLRVLPSNTPFTVTGGPECSSGFTWWHITLADGVSGWLAEGFEEDYYIAPITAG